MRWPGNKIESTYRKAAKFRWVGYTKLDCNAAADSSNSFRANSPYDPDATGIGVSAFKWTQYTSIYERYCVVKSKIRVTIIGENVQDVANPDYPGVITLYLGNDLTGLSWQNYIAQGRGTYSITSGHPAANKKNVLKATFNAKKFFNVKDIKDHYEDLGASVTANPSRDAFFILNQSTMVPLNNPKAVNCLVVIDYYVIFSEPTSEINM